VAAHAGAPGIWVNGQFRAMIFPHSLVQDNVFNEDDIAKCQGTNLQRQTPFAEAALSKS
jgi:hypothetical protein